MSLHLERALIKVWLLIAVLVELPFWSVQLHDQSFTQELNDADMTTVNVMAKITFFIFQAFVFD